MINMIINMFSSGARAGRRGGSKCARGAVQEVAAKTATEAVRRHPSSRHQHRTHPSTMIPLLLFLLWTDCLRSARVTMREAPRVQIPSQGMLAGYEVFVTRTQRARQYLGIPFAQPPVGSLRFFPPATSPLPSWEEPRNSSYQAACMQDRARFEDHDKLGLEAKLFPDKPIEFSEDCLYLNVFVPDGNKCHTFFYLRLNLSAYPIAYVFDM